MPLQKGGRHHRASNENYIITSCRCYYQRGGRTMMVFPCYHHRSKEGEPWPAKPAVIIHSSSTNICLLRFRSYRKKGERWLFPAAIVRRKWTLQVIPASICKAVSGITTNIQKRLSGCFWKDERSYFPLPSFLRKPTKKSIPADVRMDTLRVKIDTRYLPITRRSNSSKNRQFSWLCFIACPVFPIPQWLSSDLLGITVAGPCRHRTDLSY